MLRQVCDEFGDNDWPDNLHLADVIEKHLWDELRAESSFGDPLQQDEKQINFAQARQTGFTLTRAAMRLSPNDIALMAAENTSMRQALEKILSAVNSRNAGPHGTLASIGDICQESLSEYRKE